MTSIYFRRPVAGIVLVAVLFSSSPASANPLLIWAWRARAAAVARAAALAEARAAAIATRTIATTGTATTTRVLPAVSRAAAAEGVAGRAAMPAFGRTATIPGAASPAVAATTLVAGRAAAGLLRTSASARTVASRGWQSVTWSPRRGLFNVASGATRAEETARAALSTTRLSSMPATSTVAATATQGQGSVFLGALRNQRALLGRASVGLPRGKMADELAFAMYRSEQRLVEAVTLQRKSRTFSLFLQRQRVAAKVRLQRLLQARQLRVAEVVKQARVERTTVQRLRDRLRGGAEPPAPSSISESGRLTPSKSRSGRPDPLPEAEGRPHSIVERPGPEGQYTTHHGDGTYKQYRGSGQDHGGVARPNVKENTLHQSPTGPKPGKAEVRPARPDEVPREPKS